MARMTGFIFQDEYLERLAKLSDQEVGRLIRALSVYHASGKEQELAGREGVAFDFIKVDIDRIDQKYEARCETNRNNRQQSSTNDNETKETVTNGPKDKVKDKEKTKDKRESISAKTRRDHSEEAGLFARFWEAYPRKTAKSNAIQAFHKLKPDEALVNTMLAAIEKQKASAQWSDPQFIPHPATWLNGRRWEDEVVSGTGKAVAQTSYEQRDYEERKSGELPAWLKEEIEMMGGVAG
jgi:hypothetical protein